MGRVRGGGVEIREKSIRIKFVWNGEVIRERIIVNGSALAPTPPNIRYASRLAEDIRHKIAVGTFDFSDVFPESPRAVKIKMDTFGTLADAWLASKGQLTNATRDQYANAVALWKRILGGDTRIDTLDHKTLSAKIGGHPWASAKSANNYLIVLRGIFSIEYHGRRAVDNPMGGIANLPLVKKRPDPLTVDERDRILPDMFVHYDPRIGAYFQFQFFTGLRPEEAIALQWGDIDWHTGTAHVRRVRTFRGSERDGSKTHAERSVDLTTPALEALKIMKPYTFLREHGDIFENPVTRRPWHDERSQRDHYWAPTLKRLGIRKRRAYATRHTYATAALMAGVKPPYIATQLGHRNSKMVFEVYGVWIASADKGNERSALEQAFAKSPTAVPRSEAFKVK